MQTYFVELSRGPEGSRKAISVVAANGTEATSKAKAAHPEYESARCTSRVQIRGRSERIAKRVEDEITRPRLTKGGIAQQLGLSRPALGRRLDGKVEWEYDKLEALANILGITLDNLTGENHTNGTTVAEE